MFRRRKRKKGRLKVLYFTNKRNSSNAFNTDVEEAFGQYMFYRTHLIFEGSFTWWIIYGKTLRNLEQCQAHKCNNGFHLNFINKHPKSYQVCASKHTSSN